MLKPARRLARLCTSMHRWHENRRHAALTRKQQDSKDQGWKDKARTCRIYAARSDAAKRQPLFQDAASPRTRLAPLLA